ncbi:hypothetical protein L211DRAFT_852266 [Terfezia boudieri ATCC MYA-4762]|uniref:Nephrocystin 3-like N-terminal domain-containing protein n=1 Tax=Terfezia boudieri ATCC MYA-4762 TaxID=1051890 RepID=A0A3N4LGI5_9PEZI|nr:hypothetical protein L211DRAFT_852266 [Terfezia boudieri ATCC MYA-4762]
MANSRRHPGTGEWLFDRKTVMASAMRDGLKQRRANPILYFFCDYRNMSKNTVHMLLRSFTSQFLAHNLRRSATKVFAPSYLGPMDVCKLTNFILISNIETHFKELLQSYSESTYMILDGLDECDGEQQSSIQA